MSVAMTSNVASFVLLAVFFVITTLLRSRIRDDTASSTINWVLGDTKIHFLPFLLFLGEGTR